MCKSCCADFFFVGSDVIIEFMVMKVFHCFCYVTAVSNDIVVSGL